MSDAAQPDPPVPPSPAPKPPADPVNKGVKWLVGLIALSLLWYLLADRFTPYTQQARVQALVVPVAAEVAGRVIRVLAHNNQMVEAGAVLFEVDPEQYQIAVERARAELESTRRQVAASTAGIDSAQASLRAAQANELKSQQDRERLERLYREDPGTISLRRLEVSRASHVQAISQWISAEMTENNLGRLEPDTPVAIVLDALPGKVFEGRVRSVGYGVSVGQSTAPGTLPEVENSRDWLRPAQRFPVIVEFAPGEARQLAKLRGIRVGGQAEVMAFPTQGNPLNPLGRLFLYLMSWLSYAY